MASLNGLIRKPYQPLFRAIRKDISADMKFLTKLYKVSTKGKGKTKAEFIGAVAHNAACLATWAVESRDKRRK